MRTDVKIDGRAIPCPNASLLGCSYGAAKPGHCIVYERPGIDKIVEHRLGRVLGRVTTNSQIGPDSVKGWALVMRLSDDGTFAYEDWVNPAWIRRVIDPPTAMAEFFFSAKLPYDVHTMRRLMDHGTTQNQFISQHAERVAMFDERDEDANRARQIKDMAIRGH